MGYGDITPSTYLGKIVVGCMIVCSFVMIPLQLNKVTALVALQSRYRTKFKNESSTPHFIVVGHVTDANVLRDFFMELYHPDRFDGSESSLADRQVSISGSGECCNLGRSSCVRRRS